MVRDVTCKHFFSLGFKVYIYFIYAAKLSERGKKKRRLISKEILLCF